MDRRESVTSFDALGATAALRAPIASAKELLCWYRIRKTNHQSIP